MNKIMYIEKKTKHKYVQVHKGKTKMKNSVHC